MGFSADWLALRADADARARDKGLEGALVTAMANRPRPIRVLDLGSGTGANLHALAPVLGERQHWTLVDNDPVLLATITAPPCVEARTITADLNAEISPVFQTAPDLVTASAFFDLAGPGLIDRIVSATVGAGAVFYTVLTYDGREVWSPSHALDRSVLDAFHADQRRDKGLGPALGPDATAALADAFRDAGYQVRTGASDWVLDQSRDAVLIRALAEGSANAVKQAVPGASDWAAARATSEHVVIGHQDLLAVPAGA